jgi:hypothetical protein
MIIEEIRNIKSDRKDLRNFGLAVGSVLFIIGGVLLWRHRPAWPYFLGAGGALILLGLAVPRVLKPLQKAWMALAVVMGWVMTRVILGVLFYLVFTPIGLTARIFGKRFLDLGRKGKKDSYWNYRKGRPDRDSYEKQF